MSQIDMSSESNYIVVHMSQITMESNYYSTYESN